jgi:hypothetical protein
MLRVSELNAAYASAWDEWEGAGEAKAWEAAAADGLAGGRPPEDAPPGREPA